MEGTSPNALVSDFCKPTFHLIEPRGTGGRKMQVVTRMFLEPGSYFGGFVRCVIVHDQVNVQRGRHLAVNAIQEAQKFLMPMAPMALADDLAGSDVQRGKQGGRAVPLIIMGPTLGLSWAHRQ